MNCYPWRRIAGRCFLVACMVSVQQSPDVSFGEVLLAGLTFGIYLGVRG
jgi:hypothetical protein